MKRRLEGCGRRLAAGCQARVGDGGPRLERGVSRAIDGARGQGAVATGGGEEGRGRRTLGLRRGQKLTFFLWETLYTVARIWGIIQGWSAGPLGVRR